MIQINTLLYLLFLTLPISLITGTFLPDFIISISGLIFLIFQFKNLRLYLSDKLIIFFILFYFFMMLSGLLSENIYNSLINYDGPIFYFRFIIFAVVTNYLLNLYNQKIIDRLCIFFLILFFFICLDAIIQFLFGYNTLLTRISDDDRITGIFKDEMILGHFIGSFVSFILGLIILSDLKMSKSLIFLFLIPLCLIVSYFSGDRVGFGKVFLISLFVIFYLKIFNGRQKIIISSVLILIILIIPLASNKVSNRISDAFHQMKSLTIPFLPFTPLHEQIYISGLKMFYDKPVLGHGPQIYRSKCKNIEIYNIENSCSNHSHNYYIQLLSENGLIGFAFLILFYLYLLQKFFRTKVSTKYGIAKILFIFQLLVNLIPIMPHMGFYNNFFGIILFFPIGFILYLDQLKKY